MRRHTITLMVLVLSLVLLPYTAASADGGGGGFVTAGGWIDSPPGACYPMDLPFFDGSY